MVHNTNGPQPTRSNNDLNVMQVLTRPQSLVE